MKNKWNTIRIGLTLFALPLVVTAAASASLRMSESAAIFSPALATVSTSIGINRSHTVALDQDGSIKGKVGSFNNDSTTNGLSGLSVRFVQDGNVVKETVTAADGTFSVQGLPEGIYSFFADGENGFAAYGIRVVAEGDYEGFFEVAAVSPNVQSVYNDLQSKSQISKVSTSSKRVMDARGSNRVALKGDLLKGRLMLAKSEVDSLEKTNVRIFQNSVEIASVEAASDGTFEVPNIKSGFYDLLAVGPYGTAALGFEAVGTEFQAKTEASKVTFVSTRSQDFGMPMEVPQDMNIYMVERNETPVYYEEVYYEDDDDRGYLPIEYASQDIGYGSAVGSYGPGQLSSSGFSGGGGGGGFGGRGIGRLALIGGLAVGIIALSDNNNPTDASPAKP